MAKTSNENMEKIRKEIESMRTRRKKDAEELAEQKEQAKKEAAELAVAMDKASRQGNLKMYTAAVSEKEKADKLLEMCEMRIKELQNGPLMDFEKDTELYEALKACKAEAEEKLRQVMKNAFQEMREAVGVYDSEVDRLMDVFMAAYYGKNPSGALTLQGVFFADGGALYHNLKVLFEKGIEKL